MGAPPPTGMSTSTGALQTTYPGQKRADKRSHYLTDGSYTHMDNEGSGAGVLGPGFWGTRRLAKLAVGYTKPPAPERLIVHVCKINSLVPELFFILKKCRD